jgi:trehalose 6-phosphate phosphatase
VQPAAAFATAGRRRYRGAVTNSSPPPWPRRTALFLDLDGTLLEFADHPAEAAVGPQLRQLLAALPRATEGALALVSGRRLADLDSLLAPTVLPAAGLHGLERRDAAGQLTRVDATGEELARLMPALREFERRHVGLLLEDKGLTLALHYRRRPELAAAVRQFVAQTTQQLSAGLQLLHGNQVVEIRPPGGDKGGAIAAFMRESPFVGRTPVFIGDDVTDEDGFRVVRQLHGLAVKVGSGATIADLRLKDVSAVIAWLGELADGVEHCANE